MLKNNMEASIDLWIEYILRFFHLVAGISWIGSSFYFIWLDSSFETPKKPRHNVDGEVFMVHGGFYYQVDKRKIAPNELPDNLHWFKWEATLTFISGFLLFTYLYLLNGASLLINKSVLDLSQAWAVTLSLSLIIVSWLIYDLIYHPKLMHGKTKLSNFIAFPLAMALIYSSFFIFSGRGSFMIIGVIFGSCMLINVWVRILPGQARMLKDAQDGKTPDYSESLKSKVRSVHNTYFIFPVLFIMLSNHYPALYNHKYNWAILIILTISGALARKAMVTKNKVERWLIVPAIIGLGGLIFITAQGQKLKYSVSEGISYDTAKEIVKNKCLSCHSSKNTDKYFPVAPKGLIFETKEQLLSHKENIIKQVKTKVMPLGNKTQITDEQRAQLIQYLQNE